LTAKLLTFASGGDPVKATASLPELVRDAAGFVLSGSNVKCTFQTPDDLWPVSMDKEQISQVIRDLVSNADQSMPEGGTILISFANRQLDEDEAVGLYPGRYVCVSLTDRGRGIERQNLDRVFDPYFSTKGKNSTKGSGLGLAIVHSIVTKHDGRIIVDSIPGKGTTFTLFLPARSKQSGTMGGRAAIVPAGKGVVLVQEASRENRVLVCDMLAHMGYKGQPALSGREAVTLYQEAFAAGSAFHAVIVDLDAPEEPAGKEVFSSLLVIDPQVRVVVAGSKLGDPQLEKNCLDLGVSACIAKPYKLLELNRVMLSLGNNKPRHDLRDEKQFFWEN
jgi:CheY-like chemotaxis protein